MTLAHLDNRPTGISEADWLIEKAKREAVAVAMRGLFDPAKVFKQAERDGE